MSDESIAAGCHAVLFFLKVCLGIVLVRVLLYYLGLKGNVPILDLVAGPLIPIFDFIWKFFSGAVIFFFKFIIGIFGTCPLGSL
jgi:hypothetical protein